MSLPAPYYDHGGITIYHADCRDILPALVAERGKFDLLLTDPPYGFDARPNHGGGAKKKSYSKHGEVLRLHDGGEPHDPRHYSSAASGQVIWGANYFAHLLQPSTFWLAWDKKADVAADGLRSDLELAWVGGHHFRCTRVYRHYWAGVLRASENGSAVLHPTQKPVALMRWCLSFFPEARTVLDPYMGSGPVARACKDAGLRYVGIEIVEKYCEIAAKRLAQEVLFA